MLRDSNINGEPVTVLNANGSYPVVIVCEHASNCIPPQFNGLGLSAVDQDSHAAWDPGALSVATLMADRLDARLVASGISRLVYDCNRPPEARSAMPEKSELIDVPGNAGLTKEQRAERADTYYKPFRDALARETLNATQAIVTIHSFTPIYHGALRTVELGILHDTDTRIADKMLALAPQYTKLVTKRNEPYGPDDGVTHTLKIHGIENGIANVMIEIRNDLLKSVEAQKEIAVMLANLLSASLKELGIHSEDAQ